MMDQSALDVLSEALNSVTAAMQTAQLRSENATQVAIVQATDAISHLSEFIDLAIRTK